MHHHSANLPLILRAKWVFVQGGLQEGLEVVLNGDKIATIRPATGPLTHPGCALLPGLVNAHSHAFQRGLRGHVQWASGQDDFWSWRDRMYSLADGLSPEGVEAVSALAFLEMALSGFTTVGEFHYVHHQPGGAPYDDPDELAHRVIRAARRVGLRIVLLRVAYARAGAGRPAEPRQRRFIDATPEAVLRAVERLRAAHRDDPWVNVGLAPHSVRAAPKEWLSEFVGFDGPLHMHVAEQPGELAQCRAEHGLEPLAFLDELGLVAPNFTAVHLTHPGADDGARLLRAGGRVCVCPTTELDLGDGFFPIERLPGVPLCIGTDSHARIDPFAELRALENHSRARLGRRNVLSPPDAPDGLAARLWGVGAGEGSRALGQNGGEIAPGAPADLVLINLNGVSYAGARPLPTIVFAGQPRDVEALWVGGAPIIEGGEHPEAARIVEDARRALSEIP
ncbi:MAG: formimidoylglutamate deiminase [Deltaproteobacteria bacterium]|nr:formimidoylglutamate deiminase [Deltaproteobacteria bacterium]